MNIGGPLQESSKVDEGRVVVATHVRTRGGRSEEVEAIGKKLPACPSKDCRLGQRATARRTRRETLATDETVSAARLRPVCPKPRIRGRNDAEDRRVSRSRGRDDLPHLRRQGGAVQGCSRGGGRPRNGARRTTVAAPRHPGGDRGARSTSEAGAARDYATGEPRAPRAPLSDAC